MSEFHNWFHPLNMSQSQYKAQLFIGKNEISKIGKLIKWCFLINYNCKNQTAFENQGYPNKLIKSKIQATPKKRTKPKPVKQRKEQYKSGDYFYKYDWMTQEIKYYPVECHGSIISAHYLKQQ